MGFYTKLGILLNVIAVFAKDCNPKYYQCGGNNWKGLTCCESGSNCKKINQWYSYCDVDVTKVDDTKDDIINLSSLVGFATMNGGTTGGQGGQEIVVRDYDSLRKAVKGDQPKIVKIDGIINLKSEIKIGSNKSVVGINKNSGLFGAGFKIVDVKNVIIKNLKFNQCLGSNKDCINSSNSTNIWVDHCEFYNDINHDKDYYDGLVDFTHGSDFITLSWNYLHDHYKASLIGHSDKNAQEDTGKLHITYHHNYFKNIYSRLPSLRFGVGHIFNNVYENIHYSCVNVRMGGQALIESNKFVNARKPILTDANSKEEGFAVERNNDFGKNGKENSISKVGTFTNPPYPYKIDNVNNIYNMVTQKAGPQ